MPVQAKPRWQTWSLSLSLLLGGGLGPSLAAPPAPDLLTTVTALDPAPVVERVPALQARYDAQRERMGSDHPKTSRALAQLAAAEARGPRGPLPQLPRYAEAIDRLIAALGPFAQTPAYLRFDLSAIYRQRGQRRQAVRLLHQALLATTRQPAPRAAALVQMYTLLSGLLLDGGEYVEAKRSLKLASEAAGKCVDVDRLLCVALIAERGAFAAALGDGAAAEARYLEALSALEALPTTDPRRQRPLELMGRLWLKQGATERGEALLLEREGLFNPERGRRQSAHPALAHARRLRGDLTGALEIYDRAIEQIAARHGWGAPALIEAYAGKALAHSGLGQRGPAQDAALRALGVAEIRGQDQPLARGAMAQVLSKAGATEQAIYFGKSALQALWQTSQKLRPLGPEAQHVFLRAHERRFTGLIEDLTVAEQWGEAQRLSSTWSEIQEGAALSPPPALSPEELAWQKRLHGALQILAQRCLALDLPSPDSRPWPAPADQRQADAAFAAFAEALSPALAAGPSSPASVAP